MVITRVVPSTVHERCRGTTRAAAPGRRRAPTRRRPSRRSASRGGSSRARSGDRPLRRRRTGRCRGRSTRPACASSSSWLPCSTMLPAFITRMRSASRIVDRRWAITKLVRCERSAAIAFWISTSVRVSTELVASSRIRIVGSARKARAMVSSCFSPALTVPPSSSIMRVVAVGQRVHEAVDVGRPGGLEDLLLGGVEVAVRDVVADRAAEQPGVLQHHADVGAQVVPRHVGDVVCRRA